MRHRIDGLAEATRRGSTVNGGRRDQPAAPVTYMKMQGTIPSGTLNNTVSFMTRYGVVVRSRAWHNSVYSEAQFRVKQTFTYYSQIWRTLSDQERAAWNKRAAKTRSRPRAGQSGPLTGHALFVKINCARAAAGLELVRLPPRTARFGPNPVGPLAVIKNGTGTELQLSVPKPPGRGVVVLVLGAAPCSAGRASTTPYTILGRLPAPVGGVSTITKLYSARFGLPSPGQRVFIRTRQLIEGWEDEPKETNALVPRE